MNLVTVIFSLITILVHVLIFVVESFLWLNPLVHERFLGSIGGSAGVSLFEQAQIMEVLFYNQGFYNLFVALGGIAGLVLYKKGKTAEGLALVCYVCLFAVGASVVLATSSNAYLGVVVQGVPPLLALLGLRMTRRKRGAA